MWRSLQRLALRRSTSVTARSMATTTTRRVATLRRVFPVTAGLGLTGFALAALEGKPKEKKSDDKAATAKPAAAAASPATASSAPSGPSAEAKQTPKTFPSDPSDPGYEMRLRILDKLGNHCPCWVDDMKGPCAQQEFACVTCMDQAMTLCRAEELAQMRALRDKQIAQRKAKAKANKAAAAPPAAPAAADGGAAAAAGDGDDDDVLPPPTEEDLKALTDEERALIRGPNCMDLTEFVIFTNCSRVCQETDKCRRQHPEVYPDGKPPSQQQNKKPQTENAAAPAPAPAPAPAASDAPAPKADGAKPKEKAAAKPKA